jgi:hypothetical protein
MTNILLISIVIIHKILVYFMFLGFLLPKKYLPFHLLVWPIVYTHWQFNDNKCILTQIELKIKNGSEKDAPSVDADHGSDYYFIKKILADFNIELTNRGMSNLTYSLFTIAWLISFIRLTCY